MHIRTNHPSRFDSQIEGILNELTENSNLDLPEKISKLNQLNVLLEESTPKRSLNNVYLMTNSHYKGHAIIGIVHQKIVDLAEKESHCLSGLKEEVRALGYRALMTLQNFRAQVKKGPKKYEKTFVILRDENLAKAKSLYKDSAFNQMTEEEFKQVFPNQPYPKENGGPCHHQLAQLVETFKIKKVCFVTDGLPKEMTEPHIMSIQVRALLMDAFFNI